MDWELLGIGINSIVNRKRRQNQIDNNDDQNYHNRGVVQYSASIESLIAQTVPNNVIVSGGNEMIRSRALCERIRICKMNNRAAVILHCGNSSINEMVNYLELGRDCVVINNRNRLYDPMKNKSVEEISRLLYAVSNGSQFQLDNSAYRLLEGIVLYLNSLGRSVSITSFANCLRDMSYRNYINEAEALGVNTEIARRVDNLIGTDTVGDIALKHFFTALSYQGESIFAGASDSDISLSIKDALYQNKIVVVDITNSANVLLIKMIINEVLDCMGRVAPFDLILDSIPIRTDNSLLNSLNSFRGGANMPSMFYLATDVYASVDSHEETFNTLTGLCPNIIVMRHSSDNSAETFSRVFGRYIRTTLNASHNTGYNYSMNGGMGTYTNSGLQEQEMQEYKVKPEQITRLPDYAAYIRQMGRDDIMFVEDMSATTTSNMGAVPERMERERVRRRSTFNFWIFLVLLLAFFPAGLIYLFVTGGKKVRITMGIILAFLLFMIIMFLATEVYN